MSYYPIALEEIEYSNVMYYQTMQASFMMLKSVFEDTGQKMETDRWNSKIVAETI